MVLRGLVLQDQLLMAIKRKEEATVGKLRTRIQELQEQVCQLGPPAARDPSWGPTSRRSKPAERICPPSRYVRFAPVSWDPLSGRWALKGAPTGLYRGS